MARYRITLTGTTPLVQHNPRLADPGDDITREIKSITGKRKKTDEDRVAIERLEWFGGLYLEDKTPVVPTANIRKCIVEAGKTRKLGKQIGRAVSFVDFTVPVIHDGPKDIEKLYSHPGFRLRATVVNNGQTRIVRVRPKFPAWALVADAEVLEDLIDPHELRDVAALAGVIEGLGDNRVNGFGRFTATVAAL
jgi:hypothetical protein